MGCRDDWPEAISYRSVAEINALQAQRDKEPCPHCGGDRLRPDFARVSGCHMSATDTRGGDS